MKRRPHEPARRNPWWLWVLGLTLFGLTCVLSVGNWLHDDCQLRTNPVYGISLAQDERCAALIAGTVDLVWCPGQRGDQLVAHPSGNVHPGGVKRPSGAAGSGPARICISSVLLKPTPPPGKCGQGSLCANPALDRQAQALHLWAAHQLRTEHAKRHGYSLFTTTECLLNACRRKAHWNKFTATQMLVKSCDYVMWMEYDAVIMNMSTRIEDIIAKAPPSADVILSGDTNVLSSGQMIFKAGRVSERLLQEAYKLGDWRHEARGARSDYVALATVFAGCNYRSSSKEKEECYGRMDRGLRKPEIAARIHLLDTPVFKELGVDGRWLSSLFWVSPRIMNARKHQYKPGDFLLHVTGEQQPEPAKARAVLAAVKRSQELNGLCY